MTISEQLEKLKSISLDNLEEIQKISDEILATEEALSKLFFLTNKFEVLIKDFGILSLEKSNKKCRIYFTTIKTNLKRPLIELPVKYRIEAYNNLPYFLEEVYKIQLSLKTPKE
jgi:hypothetical protein